MTGIDRLLELAGGIGRAVKLYDVTSAEYDMRHDLGNGSDGGYLREVLADIAYQIEREQGALVKDSPYDAILPEDRDAIAWVRAHGGLDRVKAEWSSRVPYDLYERRRQRLLGHIAECEAALGRRNQRIEELGKHVQSLTTENAELRKRSMPEGYEWPTVDGKPVDFVTGYEPSLGVLEAVSIYNNGACEVMGHDGIIKNVKEIHVVTPKVLDADGVETRVGDTVWDVESGIEYEVVGIHTDEDTPVRVMRTDGSHLAKAAKPSTLTHERPVADTWERLEEDAMKSTCGYFGHVGGETCETCPGYTYSSPQGGRGCRYAHMADLVSRAKKLAGVSE